MGKESIKTVVAGLGIASLVAGMSFSASTVLAADKQGAESTQQQGGGSGWGGKTDAGSVKEQPDKDKTTEKTVPAEQKPAKKPQPKPGSSGWGGAAGAGSAPKK